MSYSVTQNDILSVSADAAVLCIELAMKAADGPVCSALFEAGGPALHDAMRQKKFLPVGSAAVVSPGALPFRHVILVAAPRWINGKTNELLILHRCYENIFAAAEALGCQRLASPFLSTMYYRFPLEDAIHIAFTEAGKTPIDTVFVAETPELFRVSGEEYHKPEIVSYIGYYRDHAIFELDNGLFVRVDLRPEITDVMVIPYFEACYRVGTDPSQQPLPESEIARLRRIYENNDW